MIPVGLYRSPQHLPSMTRIKICGLTEEEDAFFCAKAGADALGFVIYENSPRFIKPIKLKAIVSKLPPFVTPVLVLVNPEKTLVEEAIAAAPHALLQFHGQEPEDFCCRFRRPYIKAFPVDQTGNLLEYKDSYTSASAFLLDAQVLGQPGGTGSILPWEKLPKVWGKPLILAGGLNPLNVAEAIAILRPWAVDVASGVESSPGRKDFIKVCAFIEAVRHAN